MATIKQMKKLSDVNVAKARVKQLLGKKVVLKLNRGRNRIKSYKGILSEAHPNVFVVELSDDVMDRISCSYTDMLCGEVSVMPRYLSSSSSSSSSSSDSSSESSSSSSS